MFQLLGSTVAYYFEKNGRAPLDLATLYQSIQPCLYSTTCVASRVRDIAIALGIKVVDDLVMGDWPMVKCNIAEGRRIYHLPIDQQYDRVKIAKTDECYCWTVAEAEQKGFRRAKRWVAEKTQQLAG